MENPICPGHICNFQDLFSSEKVDIFEKLFMVLILDRTNRRILEKTLTLGSKKVIVKTRSRWFLFLFS
jgi:hypothetical protein